MSECVAACGGRRGGRWDLAVVDVDCGIAGGSRLAVLNDRHGSPREYLGALATAAIYDERANESMTPVAEISYLTAPGVQGQR